MKKLFLILAVVTITSCTPDEPKQDCQKITSLGDGINGRYFKTEDGTIIREDWTGKYKLGDIYCK